MTPHLSRPTLGVRIAYLFPRQMSLYGDLGNVSALVRRLEWRGLTAEVLHVHPGERPSFQSVDLVFMGGGQDRGQQLVAEHLLAMGQDIREQVQSGLPALVVCGGFQLFGRSFRTVGGEELPGISVFDARTVGGARRYIGNVVVDATAVVRRWKTEAEHSGLGELAADWPPTLVGFENHSGLTHLSGDTLTLGPVLQGYGNLGDGSGEGAIVGYVVGTYLHGPVLPKNPHLADWLLLAALRRRYGEAATLQPLDNRVELAAHEAAIERAATARTSHLFQH